VPTVADYAVLRDGNLELASGESFETPAFFAPEGFVRGTNRAKAIFAFMFQALPDPPFAPSVDFTITQSAAPPIEIARYTNYTADTLIGAWETISAKQIGGVVGTTFTITVHRGRARFADIVLWYQVRI
jgi:hypothetical protein